MSCKCLTQADKALAPMGARVGVTFNVKGDVLPLLQVERVKKGRGKMPLLVPTFCPFCGKEYAR